MNSNLSKVLRKLTGSALLGALTAISNVSAAGEAPTPPQVVVHFADLNISTSQGAEALYRRIHGAAGTVCSRMYPSTEAYRWHKDSCLQNLIADAVTKVNEPALSALFASKYGMSAPIVVASARAR